jgi:hypothetical protein
MKRIAAAAARVMLPALALAKGSTPTRVFDKFRQRFRVAKRVSRIVGPFAQKGLWGQWRASHIQDDA